ncbi:beta-ketoacyl synthase N-terminal-like domain-containing protein [Aquimarina brevivitae]|uniref:3-oxoacyl-(Acyl-carrier-protein) synthase n=1 Tax=Aquimarina brevivitae TaxID=323412 RepID=A0A4Q7PGE0_9FLAO|nr:beta-ketoacyl synthase N-terminal-like domain-containing protein [Aquimarina brevivitae]RZS99574.1 3-oxoacyl-(acyl-carrier-protein) synthase [Aquimarina brevivitae]
MKNPVAITGLSSISPLGVEADQIWKSYQLATHNLTFEEFFEEKALVAALSEETIKIVDQLRSENDHYKELDDSVLYAILAARGAVKQAGWEDYSDFGVNIGSSRGATALFEKYHTEFLNKKKASTLSSPTTTLGNISSWVAQDLKTFGPEISHSITCSTALHGLLNGVAWLQSGMATKFVVGGSEAPLTPFTIAQMRALKIYADNDAGTYPCQALQLSKSRNSMCLGEGAAVICIEDGNQPDALALIGGVGYATEALQHNISISANANCFQDAMKMAMQSISPEEVDVIVMHAPGTVKGDLAEYRAIEKVFLTKKPALTTNKWKIGHTFGASGMLSLELAVMMLNHQQFIEIPYLQDIEKPKRIKNILVNAVGFGGNAVSILVQKTEKN